jgi:integrase
LIRKHVLPRWRGKDINAISRQHVKEIIRGIKAPVVANQALAATSAIFTWAIKEEVAKENPCKLIDKNETKSRERVLLDSEVPRFWSAFDDVGLMVGTALKLILLTGQRPGEVTHMRYEHIKDGWWEMPRDPDPALEWPGTKNGRNHNVWLSAPVQGLIAALEDQRDTGFVFDVRRLDTAMRNIWARLGVKEKVTPHDLRRTFSTTVTGLGSGRDAMNRVTNHKDGGIATVYDRHKYRRENQTIMEKVAAHILQLATGKGPDDKVIPLRASDARIHASE